MPVTTGFQLLDQVWNQHVVPDLFSRYVPAPVTQAPDPPTPISFTPTAETEPEPTPQAGPTPILTDAPAGLRPLLNNYSPSSVVVPLPYGGFGVVGPGGKPQGLSSAFTPYIQGLGSYSGSQLDPMTVAQLIVALFPGMLR